MLCYVTCPLLSPLGFDFPATSFSVQYFRYTCMCSMQWIFCFSWQIKKTKHTFWKMVVCLWSSSVYPGGLSVCMGLSLRHDLKKKGGILISAVNIYIEHNKSKWELCRANLSSVISCILSLHQRLSSSNSLMIFMNLFLHFGLKPCLWAFSCVHVPCRSRYLTCVLCKLIAVQVKKQWCLPSQPSCTWSHHSHKLVSLVFSFILKLLSARSRPESGRAKSAKR